MYDFFENLFSSDFMPHGHCYLWTPSILWLHVLSDLTITLSYYTIPIALFIFVRQRKDITFNWIFILFAIFIFACGTTHLMEIWNVWHGTYRLSGIIKLITGVVSVYTAFLLWPLIPKLIAIPSPKQLEDVNRNLEAEARERKLAQDKLLLLNSELEQKIQHATSELQMALAQKEESLLREREIRTEAEKASKLKDEFIATVSHELRTPLNALTSWIQVLSDTVPGAAKSSEAVPILRRNVTKLSSIIDDLLDMSMILTGSIILNLKPYDLTVVTKEVIENLRSTAEAKKIILKTDFELAPIPPLKGDVMRIRQIIWNLLTNAIKFTPEGKTISISIIQTDSTVSLTVADQGRGIDPVFLPYVFDRFRQETASSAREYFGLGIGLSIAKQLAELQGGSIVARSNGLGLGSEFILTFQLPL